ncbi:MAG: FAD-binding protein [Myxococcota bacterium]|nr:FAD-binding protein [Myxococcota bacterium]
MLFALLLGCAGSSTDLGAVEDTGPAAQVASGHDTAAGKGGGLSFSVERLEPYLEAPEPLTETDVLVIGGGPAGMAAMIEARAQGAAVLLLERSSRLGGAAIYSSGATLFSGTPEQAAEGITDSPSVLLSDWPTMTGGDPDATWMLRYAEDNVPEVYTWLTDMGGSFHLSAEQSNGESVPRIHLFNGEGLGMVGLLAGQIPMDDVMFSVEAQSLVLDAEGLSGVWVTLEGAQAFIAAQSVVVATGGFLRDPELVSIANPALNTDALVSSAAPHATGSGHHMLDVLGADWLRPGAMGLYAHGVPDPHEAGEEVVLTSLEEALWVSAAGENFLPEPHTNSYATAAAVLALPEHRAFGIFDAGSWPQDGQLFDPIVPPGEAPSLVTIDHLLDAETAHEAASLAELAYAAGIDASGLLEAADGLAAPYLAVQIAPALAKNFGGIAVDASGQVLAGGAPLPGVFAAGELTGMAGGSLVGDNPLTGCGFTGSLSAVLLSGRIAGRSASEGVPKAAGGDSG